MEKLTKLSELKIPTQSYVTTDNFQKYAEANLVLYDTLVEQINGLSDELSSESKKIKNSQALVKALCECIASCGTNLLALAKLKSLDEMDLKVEQEVKKLPWYLKRNKKKIAEIRSEIISDINRQYGEYERQLNKIREALKH